MSLSGLQVKGGWVLAKIPGGKVLGGYVMADGVSQYMGAVNDIASFVYERDSDFYYVDDWVGVAYRNAGEFYFGDEGYGDGARFFMTLSTATASAAFKFPVKAGANPAYAQPMHDGTVSASALSMYVMRPACQQRGIVEMVTQGLSASGTLYGMYELSDDDLSQVK